MWFQYLAVAVLAFGLSRGDSIKCFQCSSATDPKCGDPIESSIAPVECTPSMVKEANSLLKDAASGVSSMLGKIGIDTNLPVPDVSSKFACAKAVRQENDKKLVIRTCSIPNMESFDVCAKLKGEGGVSVCETCEKDGCNGASSAVPSSLLVLLSAALVAYLFAAKQ